MIRQPNDISVRSGTITFELRWNRSFGKTQRLRFAAAQNYIDRECVKHMTPFVPVALPKYRNAGKLARAVKITAPGRIYYLADHGRYAYYIRSNHKHGGNPQAQRLWFEPMKRQYKRAILRGAAAIAGGRAG